MRVIRAILLLVATIYFLSFIFNDAEFGWSSEHGFHATKYHGLSRFAPLLISAFCGSWYYGLRVRNLWAWRFGIVVLGIVTVWGVVDGVLSFRRGIEPFDRWYDLLGKTIAAILFCFLFGRWWWFKRRDFMTKHTA
ncbi:MAG TPA: hypothetical protein VGJ73_10340 [Verrucomicrobiae bacterium]|jgi:hypothetical protein